MSSDPSNNSLHAKVILENVKLCRAFLIKPDNDLSKKKVSIEEIKCIEDNEESKSDEKDNAIKPGEGENLIGLSFS